MADMIKVPRKVTGIRFPGAHTSDIVAGYSPEELFHQISDGWFVRDERQFKATRNPFFQGHLDPVNVQMIIGLDDIARDYVFHQSLRTEARRNDWGRGNVLGGLYVLTQADIESRLGNNNVTVGEVNHPLQAGTLLLTVSKNQVLKPGAKVVCTAHAGDCFFDYQLLHEVKGDLVKVEGMDFGAYSLLGRPIRIMKVEYTQERRE